MSQIIEQEREWSVAFGSNVPRLMFPLHSAPTKLGFQQGIRGLPGCGPGTYNAKLPHQMNKPHSLKGWYFGCRTGEARSRLDTVNKCCIPGPSKYQRLSFIKHQTNFKPFSAACPRFSPNQYTTVSPGPGRYENCFATPKKMKYNCSFGGKRTLKDVVKIKCNNGISEICSKCKQVHIRDYYEHTAYNQTLCSACHKEQNHQSNYLKVRDCKAIHLHHFPGFPPKILKGSIDNKKLQYKEAYLSVYYN